MKRCEYGVVFYRVFCATLLCVAVSLTLVLANVFVDIDSLLAGQRKDKTVLSNNVKTNGTEQSEPNAFEEYLTDNLEELSPLGNSRGKEKSGARDKRDAELLADIQLTPERDRIRDQLNRILQAYLDKMESTQTSLTNNDPPRVKTDIRLTPEQDRIRDQLNRRLQTFLEKMESIQTSITNNDPPRVKTDITVTPERDRMRDQLNRRLQAFLDKMESTQTSRTNNDHPRVKTGQEAAHMALTPPKPPSMKTKPTMDSSTAQNAILMDVVRDSLLFDEYVKNLLQQHIDMEKQKLSEKEPKMRMKTLINITPLNPKRVPTRKLNDMMKIIYNGKAFKFDEKNEIYNTQKEDVTHKPGVAQTVKEKYEQKVAYVKYFLDHLFKQYPEPNDTKKRSRRHVKVRYDQAQTTQKPTNSNKSDELFVEIETHINDKGIIGDEKKKLVKSLIDKIKLAISDTERKGQKNETKTTDIHFKRRFQNPLNKEKEMLAKKVLENIQVRELYPLVEYYDNNRKQVVPELQFDSRIPEYPKKNDPIYYTSSFTELQNSPDFMLHGVSPRLQQPLIPEMSDKELDARDLKFLIQNLDGTELSIGFNQFVDAPPDKDSLNLFSNLKNIIQAYRQDADISKENNSVPFEINKDAIIENFHTLRKRGITMNKKETHKRYRRSIQNQQKNKAELNPNEYKKIFRLNFLPYNQEINVDSNKKRTIVLNKDNKSNIEDIGFKSFQKKIQHKLLPMSTINDEILRRNLKPSEILKLSTILERRKRGLERINNLSSKRKISTFLNSKPRLTNKNYLKRNKRQIGKIRIIASDSDPRSSRPNGEDENIYVMSSGEVPFSNKAMYGEPELTEIEQGVIENKPEYFNGPYEPLVLQTRNDGLMSKYPHIFVDSKSRELAIEPIEPTDMEIADEENSEPNQMDKIEVINMVKSSERKSLNKKIPQHQELFDTLAPQKYKLTVKILPKNITDADSSFKEIHTSINKSFNKNGVIYSSLVNVSEISRILKPETMTMPKDKPFVPRFEQSKERMKLLLKNHKQLIDQQLARLNDKNKLENVLMNSKDLQSTSTQHLDTAINQDLSKAFNLNQDALQQLFLSSLPKNEIINKNIKVQHTSPLPATIRIAKTEPLENKLLKTINKNENLTNEILKRIDMNTEMLKTFLNKITEQLLSRERRRDKKESNDFVNNRRQVRDPFFGHSLEVASVNNTKHSIPYVYAYQPKPKSSIVYHGYIQANTENRKLESDFDLKNNNQTRFFIDPLENLSVANKNNAVPNPIPNPIPNPNLGVNATNVTSP